MKKFLWLLFLASLSIEARYLGTFGHTYEIFEEDLLELITKRLTALEKEGTLAKHETLIQNKIEEKIKRPPIVEGITKTKKFKTFDYDPSIRVPYDLTDHEGNIFIKKDTLVNPLNTQPLLKELIFIDGDDEEQVKWAIHKPQNKRKIILVKGSPFDLMQRYPETFYFDQEGRLTKKFGINHVPAKISQNGKLLKVEEIILQDET